MEKTKTKTRVTTIKNYYFKKIISQYINSIPFLLMDRRNLTKALIRIEFLKKF